MNEVKLVILTKVVMWNVMNVEWKLMLLMLMMD